MRLHSTDFLRINLSISSFNLLLLPTYPRPVLAKWALEIWESCANKLWKNKENWTLFSKSWTINLITQLRLPKWQTCISNLIMAFGITNKTQIFPKSQKVPVAPSTVPWTNTYCLPLALTGVTSLVFCILLVATNILCWRDACHLKVGGNVTEMHTATASPKTKRIIVKALCPALNYHTTPSNEHIVLWGYYTLVDPHKPFI